MNRSVPVALGAIALVALLSGCATPAGGSGGATPIESDSGSEIEVDAAWLDGGRMIGLVTQGSSTCIPTASDVTLSDGSLEVTLEEPAADTPCTRDMVSRVTLVAVPEGVDPTQDLDIWVTGEGYYGETDLDGVEGLVAGGETDYLPSAGWAGSDGEFLLLTWGSSTCVPVLENAEATGAAEVTLTFQTPPADQVCTMDMAPRGQVVFVDGPEDDEGVFAILTGGEFAGARVPIVGSN
ncbi:hypothetical protein GCM10009775_09580 [Microbacterium aoyamense]|uniref:Lipoprotein n=1 Tax=Microbacterium aoyamense TaxID=344166 RepID=A0ABN2PFQ8_9MICO|nr:hypothetical protein [Microbacterium aoyamense]